MWRSFPLWKEILGLQGAPLRSHKNITHRRKLGSSCTCSLRYLYKWTVIHSWDPKSYCTVCCVFPQLHMLLQRPFFTFHHQFIRWHGGLKSEQPPQQQKEWKRKKVQRYKRKSFQFSPWQVQINWRNSQTHLHNLCFVVTTKRVSFSFFH